MLNEGFFTVVACLIGISAVISPVITTVLTNMHQSKMQQISFARKEKLKLYSEFLDIMNSTLAPESFTKEISLKFKCSYSKVYLVCSDKTRVILTELNNYISINADNNISSDLIYRGLYTDIIHSMRNDLKALK